MRLFRKIWGDSSFERYAFWILIAVELLMSFTFLGYIHIPPLSVTIAYIPVIIAGALFGPAESTLVGFIFGLASMYKASASYAMAADMVFSPFFSGFPAGSLLLSIGSRTLFGLLAGLAFMLAAKSRHKRLWRIVVSVFATKLYEFPVYLALGIFLPETGYDFTDTFKVNAGEIAIAVFCAVIIELLYALYHSPMLQNTKQCIDQSVHNPYTSKNTTMFLLVFELAILCLAAFATIYFSQRASYMLEQHNITVSHEIKTDLLHLQVQFLIAVMSLSIISVILLICIYRYMAYREYRREMDSLTGLMGRRLFLHHCNRILGDIEADSSISGWFLFIDVDHFKTINDTFGHSKGDAVLKEVSSALRSTLADSGTIGRIGGDEFAAIIEKPLSKQELQYRLDRLLKKLSDIHTDTKISCSIGACRFSRSVDIDTLMEQTDEALYKAKEQGRACYVIKEF